MSIELKSKNVPDTEADAGAVARACLLDIFDGSYRLAGWREHHDPSALAQAGEASGEFKLIREAVQGLGEELGRTLWDEESNRPWVESLDPVRRPPLGQVVALATPRPRLRVWLAGLTPGGLDLAAQAAASAPTRVLGRTRLTRHSHPTQITEMVARQRPQVLLITGGHDLSDPAAQDPVLALCNLIGRGLEPVPPSQRPTLLYAGSGPAHPAAVALLAQAGGRVRQMGVENLQPAPGIMRLSPTAQALHRLHGSLSHRLPEMQGLARWITGAAPVEGLDWGFARLVRLWAAARNLPHLHGLYCGPSGWLHVWADRRSAMIPSSPMGSLGHRAELAAPDPLIRLIYTDPGVVSPALTDWPSLQLVCGEWPAQLWPRPTTSWLDSRRLAPAVAALAQTEIDAVLQVLERDLLTR